MVRKYLLPGIASVSCLRYESTGRQAKTRSLTIGSPINDDRTLFNAATGIEYRHAFLPMVRKYLLPGIASVSCLRYESTDRQAPIRSLTIGNQINDDRTF